MASPPRQLLLEIGSIDIELVSYLLPQLQVRLGKRILRPPVAAAASSLLSSRPMPRARDALPTRRMPPQDIVGMEDEGIRIQGTELLGQLFSLPDVSVSRQFPQLFSVRPDSTRPRASPPPKK